MNPTGNDYLVSYGLGGFLGRFRCVTSEAYSREVRVVIRTARGLELGTVLCSLETPVATLSDCGDLLRVTNTTDDGQAFADAERCRELVTEAQQFADEMGLPCSIVDGELLHDHEHLILQYLAWDEVDLTPLVTELSHRFRVEVQLSALNSDPQLGKEPQGCGKPNCGSEKGGCSSCGTEGGGGCSTGGCSKGKVKSAAELTAYFAELRQKMEAIH